MNDFDHAATIGCAMGMDKGEALKKRQDALTAKLRRDPNAPPPPRKRDFTLEEMQRAANYMLSLTGTPKPMPS